MDIGRDRVAAEVLYLPGISRANDGNLGHSGQRQAGLRQ